MTVDFCLLDSRVAASSLEDSPYCSDGIRQPVTYSKSTGVYLHLFGRSADGRSVVVETPLCDGLTLSMLDEHDSSESDDEFMISVHAELMERLGAELPDFLVLVLQGRSDC